MRLVQAIETNFTELHGLARNSPIATTKPEFNYNQPRAIWPTLDFARIAIEKVNARAVARYVLRTDVARFFPSIYTHSIPGQFTQNLRPKNNRSQSLVGNVLDKIIRESQDGQTIGIPVGPDTSLLIAEIVLCAVDNAVRWDRVGFRWYDDYEVSGITRGECDDALIRLERALFDFELEINASKTSILELPATLEDVWVASLRDFQFRLTPSAQLKDLNGFLSRAFEFARQPSTKRPILRYAIRRLQGLSLHRNNWSHVQHLAAQAAMHEPEVLPHVLGLLNFWEQQGYPVDRSLLGRLLKTICIEYANRFVGSEVAWAIWGFLQFSLQIPVDCVAASKKLNDDIVSILLLDARRKGLIRDRSSLQALRDCIGLEAFEGEHWLLAYEGTKKSWLRPPPSLRSDFVSNHHVKCLLDAGVYFYEDNWPTDATAEHFYGSTRRSAYEIADTIIE
ncbi:MAG: RNA-directed DNA polymerase [Acidobacteria bacterium]|nr:RNA-directed DNA polymerase [Acidobacteriota bacterium]